MSTNEFYYEQVANMIRKGRSPEYIAARLKKSVTWVEEAALNADVIERSNEMRILENHDADAEMWDKERTSLEIQAMGPEMIRNARSMANNPNVADAVRAKMIELCLKYNEQMPQPKDAAGENSAGIYIDPAVGERLLDLAASRARRQQLNEGSVDTDWCVAGDTENAR